MNPRLRDFLTIGMAMLAILLCGYAVGFLLGEKKGSKQTNPILVSTPTSRDKKAPWVEQTLAKFETELQFTPHQKEQATIEIEKTYDEILKSRIKALREYSTHIAELHSRLLPHLDEAQKEEIEEQLRRLKQTLDLGLQ